MLNEDGATTAEYVIITLAAVGFAGLLLSILRSDEVRTMLLEIIRGAITPTGG
jgi:Flp pilus assembly pilin Flp